MLYEKGYKFPGSRLTVIENMPVDVNGNSKVRCLCDCGNEWIGPVKRLKNGGTRSCGCLQREAVTSHGQRYTPLYNIYTKMIDRCINPKNTNYKYYGERGIKVCDRWNHNFKNFYEDMHEGYLPGLQIDRIDNNKGYEPSNCRWATQKENARNKRNNNLIVINCEVKTLPEWAEIVGLPCSTIRSRLKRGWQGEDLLLPPKTTNLCQASY